MKRGTMTIVALLTCAASALALSHDGFDPADPAASGSGWSGPWSTSAYLSEPAQLPLADESLAQPQGVTPPATGGRLTGFRGAVFRGLAVGQELDLASDSPWYLRVTVRRSADGEEEKTSRHVTLLLHDQVKRVLAVGCTSSGKLSIVGDGDAHSPKPAVALDHTYVWLIRLDAPDADGKRRVRMLLVHDSKTFPAAEPTAWSLVSEPMSLAGAIDRVGLAAGKHARAEIDELRLASSWNELLGK